MDQPYTLADAEKLGRTRKQSADRLKGDVDALTEVVVALLKAGEKPTAVAAASQWTPAHVRKLARDHGIPADERYAERAAKLRKPRG